MNFLFHCLQNSLKAYHFVLFTMWNGEIKTLNMNSGKIKLLASENDEAVECCQIEPTSLRAVTGGADGTVQGWNIINGKDNFYILIPKFEFR